MAYLNCRRFLLCLTLLVAVLPRGESCIGDGIGSSPQFEEGLETHEFECPISREQVGEYNGSGINNYQISDNCSNQEPQTLSSLYVVKPSLGKGLGAFARHHLPRGTKILLEAPLVRVSLPEFLPGLGFRIADMMSSITSSFQALNPEEQEEYLGLHEHRFESDTDPHLPIFRSNSYSIGEAEVALFPKIARINHSCRPNAGHWWSDKRGEKIVYAARDIEEGEEITTSYIPLLKPTAERNERLAQYGFSCGCEACMESDGKGDRRRKKIAGLLEALEGELYPKERTAKGMMRLEAKAASLIELVEQEGLMDYLARSYHLAAVFGKRRELWADARMWAEKELEMYRLADEDSVEILDAIDFISSLK